MQRQLDLRGMIGPVGVDAIQGSVLYKALAASCGEIELWQAEGRAPDGWRYYWLVTRAGGAVRAEPDAARRCAVAPPRARACRTGPPLVAPVARGPSRRGRATGRRSASQIALRLHRLSAVCVSPVPCGVDLYGVLVLIEAVDDAVGPAPCGVVPSKGRGQ